MKRGYDIDGVLILKDGKLGAFKPSRSDVIITGRSFFNAYRTVIELSELMIYSAVYFNPLPPEHVNPVTTMAWKAEMIRLLGVEQFFEDDAKQVAYLREQLPSVLIEHVT